VDGAAKELASITPRLGMSDSDDVFLFLGILPLIQVCVVAVCTHSCVCVALVLVFADRVYCINVQRMAQPASVALLIMCNYGTPDGDEVRNKDGTVLGTGKNPVAEAGAMRRAEVQESVAHLMAEVLTMSKGLGPGNIVRRDIVVGLTCYVTSRHVTSRHDMCCLSRPICSKL